MARGLDKYRTRWLAPEGQLAALVPREYSHALVVPARREEPTLLQGYAAAATALAARGGSALCILVVNATADATAEDRTANDVLLASVRGGLSQCRQLASGAWWGRGEACDILLLDKSSREHALPSRKGVGQARRIGCDVALELFARGALSEPWIANTDADVTLPKDYFLRLSQVHADDVAATFPFVHVPGPDADLHEATLEYERSLRYHLLGLNAARSPYAFHTVGSCVAVRPEAYALVHGFPDRLAAEDFYLLGKVAKLGPIARLTGAPVRIQSRASDRTPFGTGVAVEARLTGAVRRVADPRCFTLLGAWLRLLDDFAQDRDLEAAQRALSREHSRILRSHWDVAQVEHELTQAAAVSASPRQLSQRLHTWFDGFRTLKFLHAARDHGYRDVVLSDALEQATFLPSAEDRTAEVLRRLEGRLAPRVGPTLPRA